MLNDTLEAELREIVARIAEISPDFPTGADLRDELEVDSFRAIEIVFELERKFRVKVPDSRYGEVQTFGDLLRLISELKG